MGRRVAVKGNRIINKSVVHDEVIAVGDQQLNRVLGLSPAAGMLHMRGISLAAKGLLMPFYAPLPHRALVAVRGPDRESFLQALVSNDVTRVTQGEAIWAALLTPQGKFLHEFFMFAGVDDQGEDTIWLECEFLRREDLVARLA